MIYVSSSCLKKSDLFSSIHELHSLGFNNIELSGGANYIKNLNEKLLFEKSKGINFRLHNYFPPPEKHFVVNLCGQDSVVEQSIRLMKSSIEVSDFLDSRKVGFHAGFKVNPGHNDLGKPFYKTELLPHNIAIHRFSENFNIVKKHSLHHNVSLYLENNVVSEANYKTYGNTDPFLLTTSKGLKELKRIIDFNLLLDVGHLKVSAKSHSLNFEEELSEMIEFTDYIHISDNSGIADDNFELNQNSEMFSILRNLRQDIKDMDFTIEVYSGASKIRSSYDLLSSLL